MEELYAELLLWYIGFHTSDRYRSLLDEKFLQDSENEIYLELEECSSSLLDSMGRFKRYWDYECSEIDKGVFGQELFKSLKVAYDTNNFEIAEFGKRCYMLWNMLPNSIDQIEPFHILSYADDPLSWGVKHKQENSTKVHFLIIPKNVVPNDNHP